MLVTGCLMIKRLTLVLAGLTVTAVRKAATRVRQTLEVERSLAVAAHAVDGESLTGNRVLITGSTRGIGRALATAFARQGASVVVHGRGESDVQRAVAAIAQASDTSDRIRGVAVDLSRAGAGRELVERTVIELGGLDIVINNAGIHDSARKPIWCTSSEEMLRALTVNCLAAFDVSVAAGRSMMARGIAGRILNISTGAADSRFVSDSGIASYGISKIALEGVSEYLAAEAHAITVTTLRPGTIATDMVTPLYPPEQRWTMLPPDSMVPAVMHLLRAPRQHVHGKVFEQVELIRMLAGAPHHVVTASPINHA
jgi:NAD(P)-dependent dehydrogenase (short-subunit alcohol dehydrogenase family)